MLTPTQKTQDFDATLDAPLINPETERRLLDDIATGDSEAFWELWLYYRPLFARCCHKWMPSQADAEDALSGATLKGAQQLPVHAHRITNAKAWLIRFLYNHCMYMYRINHGYSGEDTPDASTATHDHIVMASPQKHTEAALLDRELRLHIRRAITQLPKSLQASMVLYFFHDMPQRDIATHLGVTPAAVRKRLQRGRAILQQKLMPYFTGTSVVPRRNVPTDDLLGYPFDSQAPWTSQADAQPQAIASRSTGSPARPFAAGQVHPEYLALQHLSGYSSPRYR